MGLRKQHHDRQDRGVALQQGARTLEALVHEQGAPVGSRGGQTVAALVHLVAGVPLTQIITLV